MRKLAIALLLAGWGCAPDPRDEPCAPDGGHAEVPDARPSSRDLTAEWCYRRFLCGISRDAFNACVIDHPTCVLEPALTSCDEALEEVTCNGAGTDLQTAAGIDGCITSCDSN